MARSKPNKTGSASLPRGTFTVTDLEQIRALADPLRLRILGGFCSVPRTTMQVAEILGEKPTKLYHHVDALERVGLIRLVETRPNRGTMEKYYQAVAARFQAGISALSPSPDLTENVSTQQAVLNSILDTARDELLACLHPGSSEQGSVDEAPLVARILIHGSSNQKAVRRRLLQWIEKLRSQDAAESTTEKGRARALETYTLTVVLCKTGAAGAESQASK